MLLSAGIRSIHKDIPAKGSACRPQVRPAGSGAYPFIIETKKQRIYTRTCILATGGKAAPKTGSDGSGYIYATQNGHRLIPPLPALVPLEAGGSRLKLPAGVRTGCRATLYTGGTKTACEQGELQITDYGISGIVIFQFSRFVSRALADHRQVHVLVDFKPDIPQAQLAAYLQERLHSPYHAHKSPERCLNGFLPDKLIPVILKKAALPEETAAGTYSSRQCTILADTLKHYKIMIKGTKGFGAAQVTTGGIPVSEINPLTMESGIMQGLYFCGEIVDVDAKCGGYNLQWAWTSGYTAGKSSAAYCAETPAICNVQRRAQAPQKMREEP